ncbi:PWWP domain-containing protein 2A-like [Periplaneta americana]|uniref:PWWP domain-containing protein 2A-like n=1 Tax=Periplaneta americana TaxID=6978 RepID=UPI0037E7D214
MVDLYTERLGSLKRNTTAGAIILPANMADMEPHSQIKIVKNSKILVNVEEALQDILVVSYAFENKLYQGVLLDSTKKHLPCGIASPLHFGSKPEAAAADEDKLFALGQRFTYFQDKQQPFHLRRTIRPPARYKNSRMTVRLRPRQVLCSKCRSICNENSENVDLSRKRKGAAGSPGEVPSKSPRPLFSENQRDNQPKGACSPPAAAELCPSLIPKLSRLQPAEISSALGGKYWDDDAKERMVLRKKRSVGSMEDLWDESVFEDSMRKDAERKAARNARTTPVIKISFGSQGEGTVLKIPAKVQNYIPSESDTDERKTKDASAKAAKRALKKAKKEARRKMLQGSPRPPGSPGSAPALAPPASPAYEALYHRKHKHKVKHKKKHKEERRHGKDDALSAIKERCLKQKLSISLKRLSANAYYLGSNGSKSPATSSCSNSELSDDHGETVPDFPPQTSHPLMMRISTQTVGWCVTGDGRRMAVGDVVWGKIHGFPWWPGKVLSITISRKDDGASLAPQAHVAWYGSSTSSLMPCDQLSPFLETFKTRYNKKKRGPYKEAIRQATSEARRDDRASILPVTSSPREVNVMS